MFGHGGFHPYSHGGHSWSHGGHHGHVGPAACSGGGHHGHAWGHRVHPQAHEWGVRVHKHGHFVQGQGHHHGRHGRHMLQAAGGSSSNCHCGEHHNHGGDVGSVGPHGGHHHGRGGRHHHGHGGGGFGRHGRRQHRHVGQYLDMIIVEQSTSSPGIGATIEEIPSTSNAS